MAIARTGLSLAASAAVVAIAAASTPTFAAEDGAKAEVVHCYGVNSCKGTSDCKSAKHDCKGQNDCKGQGFKAMTLKACNSAGGATTEPK